MQTNSRSVKGQFKPRQQRIFSEELKKKLVEEIEFKKLKIKEVVILYKVAEQTVYQWIKKYSLTKQTNSRMVVESESASTKVEKLNNRIKELEQALGRKQLEVDFWNKAGEILLEEEGIDIKKKYSSKHLNGFG